MLFNSRKGLLPPPRTRRRWLVGLVTALLIAILPLPAQAASESQVILRDHVGPGFGGWQPLRLVRHDLSDVCLPAPAQWWLQSRGPATFNSSCVVSGLTNGTATRLPPLPQMPTGPARLHVLPTPPHPSPRVLMPTSSQSGLPSPTPRPERWPWPPRGWLARNHFGVVRVA